ncbi:MAG: hypothetical protein GF417_04935 [Candidatus Latescibacteria bacterium]|nr:hypothetical protein [bacterium]MBD3423766.1 hypothetical protein [Candidatus Latescibacterota bacterium]
MDVNEYTSLYISETEEIIQALESGMMKLEEDSDLSVVDELFRHAHNLKGMSGAMGFDSIVQTSHMLENILDSFRKGDRDITREGTDTLLKVVDTLRSLVSAVVEPAGGEDTGDLVARIEKLLSENFTGSGEGDSSARHRTGESGDSGPGNGEKVINRSSTCYSKISSTRVELRRLDELMDLVGELIISRIKLSNMARELNSKALTEELASSSRLVSEIQKEVMEARLVPAGNVFQRFKRVVRDISGELNKKVRLKITGPGIGVDRTVLETMLDPIVHLIRNAIDHGIETPEERVNSGKCETGTVEVSVRRERNYIVLGVSDDGSGIDLDKVGRPGGETGRGISGEELCRILAEPGFSTREKAGRYSGRGVGMNVVKKTVDSLGGSLDVVSEKGAGTRISAKLPINLSIIKAMLFMTGDQIHAIPAEYIRETVRVEIGSLKRIGSTDVYLSQDGPIPVIRPWEIYNNNIDRSDSFQRYFKIIVLDAEKASGCLAVDRILGQQDVVIKSLPGIIRGTQGISGATVLGSGKVAFIWDPRFLLRERNTNEFNQEAVLS